MHCALLHIQTAKHHGCNEFVQCCMPRPQSILFHIAFMANTQMSLSHSRYLHCYLKIRYIHGALRSGYATIRNATIQKTTFFELSIYIWYNVQQPPHVLIKFLYVHVLTVHVFCNTHVTTQCKPKFTQKTKLHNLRNSANLTLLRCEYFCQCDKLVNF